MPTPVTPAMQGTVEAFRRQEDREAMATLRAEHERMRDPLAGQPHELRLVVADDVALAAYRAGIPDRVARGWCDRILER